MAREDFDREVYRCRFCGWETMTSAADPSNPCPGCDTRGWYVLATATSDVDEDALDLTPMQERVLEELEVVGEASASELKLILEVSEGIYRNLRELRDAGKVTARDDPEDGRRTLYSLPEHDTGETDALDHTDVDDLQRAYDDADGVISTAADRFEVTYHTVYKRMVDAGVHEPASSTDDDDETDESEPEPDENRETASSTTTGNGESEDAATEEPNDEDDDDEIEASEYERQCGCGRVFDDSFAYAIHRTEDHNSPTSALGYLEPGEFATIVEDSSSVQEVSTETDWSTERVLRALNIYGLEEIVGPSDVQLSDITAVDVLEEVDPATIPAQDADGAGDEAGVADVPDESPAEESELLRFADYSADEGSVKSAECQNCGSHVDRQFVRVFEPEDEEAPRCCPNCEDLIRDRNGIRKKRRA